MSMKNLQKNEEYPLAGFFKITLPVQSVSLAESYTTA